MKTKTAILAALAALTVAGAIGLPAVAREGEHRGMGPRAGQEMRMPSFADLDVDGNGAITAADLEARRAGEFAAIDADGDGTVTADELTAHARAQVDERIARNSQRMIDRMDANDDGVLSQDEMAARAGGRGPGSLIERADADGNGEVSPEEFEAAMKDARQRGPGGGEGRGHGGGHGGQRG